MLVALRSASSAALLASGRLASFGAASTVTAGAEAIMAGAGMREGPAWCGPCTVRCDMSAPAVAISGLGPQHGTHAHHGTHHGPHHRAHHWAHRASARPGRERAQLKHVGSQLSCGAPSIAAEDDAGPAPNGI